MTLKKSYDEDCKKNVSHLEAFTGKDGTGSQEGNSRNVQKADIDYFFYSFRNQVTKRALHKVTIHLTAANSVCLWYCCYSPKKAPSSKSNHFFYRNMKNVNSALGYLEAC